MNKNHIIGGAIFLSGVAAGAAAGVYFARAKYTKIAEEEIESVRNSYKLIRKEGEFETPEKAHAALLQDYAGTTDEDSLPVQPRSNYIAPGDIKGPTGEVGAPNVVQKAKGDRVDYKTISEKNRRTPPTDEELAEAAQDESDEAFVKSVTAEADTLRLDEEPSWPERTPDRPYLIRVDEYIEDNQGVYGKETVTYYEGDDVLVDVADRPVENIEDMVGSDALTRFGQGSNDKNIAYVRNEQYEVDYEIIRDKGSYSEIVLGFTKDGGSRGGKMPSDD